MNYTVKPLEPALIPAVEHMTFPLFVPTLRTISPDVIGVVGLEGGTPVGLALTQVIPSRAQGEVLSVFVDEEHRGQGLGTMLLEELERMLQKRGVNQLFGNYVPANCEVEALEALLEKLEWTEAQPGMLVVASTIERLKEAEWLQKGPDSLGEGYEIFAWAHLSEEDEADMLERQDASFWIPEDLLPFNQEFDPETSVGLKRDGKVVGWVLTRRMEPTVLYFSSSYLHRDLQKSGAILTLYAVVAARMQELGIPNCLWMIPSNHAPMISFAKKRMQPYATTFSETLTSSKWLTE